MVGYPFIQKLSLIAMGIPSSGDNRDEVVARLVEDVAASIASCDVIVMKALFLLVEARLRHDLRRVVAV